MSILWNSERININIDITGKEIGDSVPSPISAKRLCELSNIYLFNLKIHGLANSADVVINTSNYYTVGEGDEAQVIFLTGLPVVDGVQLSSMILIDSEFTLIGVAE